MNHVWRLMLIGLALSSARAEEGPARLARELSAEGDHLGAAVEFRRLALQADPASEKGGWFWRAGHAYWQAGEGTLADQMLDRAEDADPTLAAPAVLLRGQTALDRRDFDAAAFYFESAARAPGADDQQKTFAGRRLAAARLQQGQVAEAREALAGLSVDHAKEQAALEAYAEGRDRSPALGGWLGLVPGLGYAYAGEYANGLRSLILNSLFIWGMVSTAEEAQWGAFAAIAFFEITWYSGSIYGGVDASHRYNRNRLQRAVEALSAGAIMTPDDEALPALRLRYTF